MVDGLRGPGLAFREQGGRHYDDKYHCSRPPCRGKHAKNRTLCSLTKQTIAIDQEFCDRNTTKPSPCKPGTVRDDSDRFGLPSTTIGRCHVRAIGRAYTIRLALFGYNVLVYVALEKHRPVLAVVVVGWVTLSWFYTAA